MKGFKRIACAAGGLLMLSACFGFAGCGGKGGGNEPPRDEQGNVIVNVDKNISATIKFAYKDENKEKAMLESMAELFKTEYPNVEFEFLAMASSGSTDIERLIRAGEKPDIFPVNSFDTFALDDKEYLLDFSPYIEREKELGSFNMDDYYEVYFKLGQRDFNGAQLLIPRSADRVVVHYNKKIISDIEKETGENIQQYIHNGWTWSDFETVCSLLSRGERYSGKKAPIVDSSCNWEAVYNPVFQHFGVKYFDENNKLAIDSAETRQALDMFKHWADEGWIGTTGKAAGFMEWKGAMFIHSQPLSRVAEELKSKATPDIAMAEDFSQYYDVVTMPVFAGDERIGAGVAGYAAYSGTENPVLVWKFMKMLLSKAGQNALADAGAQSLPIRRDMADFKNPENHWGKGLEKYNLEAYTFNMGGKTADGTPIPDWSCYTDYFIAPGYTKYAAALNSQFGLLVQNYCDGVPYDVIISSATREITATLRK